MDKATEINSSPENLQIPENWQFPERGNPGLKLIQNDPGERFLALTVPDGKGHKLAEYFFDTEGNISGYLIVPGANSLNNIDVGLTSDIKVIYNIGRNIGSGLHMARGLNDIHVFLIFSKENLIDPEFEEMLGNFHYKDGELHVVDAGSIFAEGENIIESPRFFLKVRNDDSPWTRSSFGFDVHQPSEYDSSKREFDTGNFVLRRISRQKLDVIDKDKKQVFEIEFGVESDREEHRRQSLFISQKHTPTGIVKTLKAPLRVNYGKVREVALSKPPYPKDDRGRLVVPWRDIDRIVGASISYSYPPPKQS